MNNSNTITVNPNSTSNYTAYIRDEFGCLGQNQITVNVDNLNGGQISRASGVPATVCAGRTPGAINGVAASGGSGSGNYLYQW